MNRHRRNPATLALVCLALTSAESQLPSARLAAATRTVTTLADAGPGSFRHAIEEAAAGDTVLFAGDLVGKSIILTNGQIVLDKDITIQGPGLRMFTNSLTINGNSTSRAFHVIAAQVSISDLILESCAVTGTNGLDPADFGLEAGPGQDAAGGAILNSGGLTLSNCLFFANGAAGGRGGHADAFNRGLSGQGGAGGAARGGAIANSNALTLTDCIFWFNAALGGAGGRAGEGRDFGDSGGHGGATMGGAVFNAGVCTATACSFYQNQAAAGDGGRGGDADEVGGDGGGGGNADGGAILNDGTLSLQNGTLAENHCLGGKGGDAGNALSDGHGGPGGRAAGGALATGRPSALIHSTLADNVGEGGDGGASRATPGDPGAELGPGLWTGTNLTVLLNTLVARNRHSTGPQDVTGEVASQGHNLVSATNTSSGWLASDLVASSATPLQADLGKFDGVTFPLLPCSPAIDAGSDAVLAPPYSITTDARGISRQSGAHVDIGAYEWLPAAIRAPIVTNPADSGPGSLRRVVSETMAEINVKVCDATITFDPSLNAQTIILTSGPITINASLTIDASALRDGIAISGNNAKWWRWDLPLPGPLPDVWIHPREFDRRREFQPQPVQPRRRQIIPCRQPHQRRSEASRARLLRRSDPNHAAAAWLSGD